MKINWIKAITAGLAGTVLFDLMGLLLTGTWWDIPGLLGAKLGVGLAGGVAAHYGNGAALAIIYAAMRPSLFGPDWFRAVSFITVQTVMGVWLFMLPLLGAGVAGLNLGIAIPFITLARHYAFVVPFLVLLKDPASGTVKPAEGSGFVHEQREASV
jgi:hypothetical protein